MKMKIGYFDIARREGQVLSELGTILLGIFFFKSLKSSRETNNTSKLSTVHCTYILDGRPLERNSTSHFIWNIQINATGNQGWIKRRGETGH